VFLSFQLQEFLGNHVVESSMEMVKVEGGVAVFLSEYLGDINGFEFIGE